MKKFFSKIFKSESKDEKYKNLILSKINKFQNIILNKKNISFLHYGHLGDIINSLPVIKEISKNKKCQLFIQKEKPIPKHVLSRDHPFGNVYLSEKSINKLLPLLNKQSYLDKVEIFHDQEIDIDLNFFRSLPYNFNMDSIRWYFHLVGVFPSLNDGWLELTEENQFKDYIVIMRSLRRQNKFINYSFLEKYKKIVFIGLKNEFDDLNKQIKNMEYFDSKDFLQLASVIKNAKLFIGNLSFGFALAEAIKVPRLLESFPNFPMVYPNGKNAYDFYFQNHFESLVSKLYSK